LRASPFTEDVFDDDYYGRRRRGSGISFGTIAAVIFVSAVVAAMGWYFLAGRGDTSAAVEGGAPVVKADPMPYKYKPDDPGGLQVENQDKLIYDRMAKESPPKRVENLLPEPEAPRAPPIKEPEKPRPAAATKAEEPKADAPKATAEVPKAETPKAKDIAATPEKAPEPAAAAAPEEPKRDAMADLVAQITGETKTPSAPAASAPTAPPASRPMLLVPRAAEDQPSAQVASAPTPLAAPAPAPTSPTQVPGAISIQLASARSQEAAMSEWKRISGRNADILGSYTPSVVQAEVPEKGTYYRLRVGPFADKATADALCAQLAQRSVSCITVRQ
jgi:hypothetical protein